MKENSIDLASKKRSIPLNSTALIHTKLTRAQSRTVVWNHYTTAEDWKKQFKTR